jgi:hypothetical protein
MLLLLLLFSALCSSSIRVLLLHSCIRFLNAAACQVQQVLNGWHCPEQDISVTQHSR